MIRDLSAEVLRHPLSKVLFCAAIGTSALLTAGCAKNQQPSLATCVTEADGSPWEPTGDYMPSTDEAAETLGLDTEATEFVLHAVGCDNEIRSDQTKRIITVEDRGQRCVVFDLRTSNASPTSSSKIVAACPT